MKEMDLLEQNRRFDPSRQTSNGVAAVFSRFSHHRCNDAQAAMVIFQAHDVLPAKLTIMNDAPCADPAASLVIADGWRLSDHGNARIVSVVGFFRPGIALLHHLRGQRRFWLEIGMRQRVELVVQKLCEVAAGTGPLRCVSRYAMRQSPRLMAASTYVGETSVYSASSAPAMGVR
jgi:hypothetical protein